ncbi:MAG: DUF1015 domain-containing protein [Chloroflexi bacterium]|nr:DUF1015 domain-containing protein [Chloroflexota bacterium]
MPEIRPFRALRFDPEVVGDVGRVLAPPYDVISPEERAAFAARSRHNVVRIDLPASEPADTDPDERYRQAARTYASWRSDGTLRRDPRPSLYVHEQTYAVPGSSVVRVQRGFMGRLRLEPFAADGGIRPHERTLSGPKEDRWKLMRATSANLSPVVGLYADPSGRASALLAGIAARPAAVDVTDDEEVRHRLWMIPADGPDSPAVAELAALVGGGHVDIADGHHRYETALRYRDERRRTSAAEPDPAYDFILALLFEATAEQLTVLATHRLVHGLDDAGVEALLNDAATLFTVQRTDDPGALGAAFSPAALAPGGEGRFGLWTRRGGAFLRARREAFVPWLPDGGDALRRLDVTLVDVALGRLLGLDGTAVAAGDRVAYTKSAPDAIGRVHAGDADAAFLLDPTPIAEIAAVAAVGDVMPQKSTYFYPKALTGLVLNPLEQ